MLSAQDATNFGAEYIGLDAARLANLLQLLIQERQIGRD